MIVDVHAHMDLEGYEMYGGADKLIEECAANDVNAIVCNGVNVVSNRKVLDICSKHKICKAALGIYPIHCLEMIEAGKQAEFDDEIRFVDDLLAKKKIIAIGEVGLDFKEVKDISDEQKNIQKKCLKTFLDLAVKHDVPLILHSRGAELDLIEFLEQNGMKNKKVIMHCFSGRKHHIKRIKDNGWFFSIPCTILRTQHFQQIVLDAPLENILTETDSPYLSPTIGKTNRPDNIKYTIAKIAELKGLTKVEVQNIIYNNYQRVFN